MIEIVLISIASMWFTEMSNIPQTIKYYLCYYRLHYTKIKALRGKYVYMEKSIKPFDCAKCLAFWGAVAYTLANHYRPLDVLLLSCLSSFIAIILTKLYNYDFKGAL